MGDSENEETDWGGVVSGVCWAGVTTFLAACITVNLIWLASINATTLEKLLPVMDESYPKEVPPKGLTGLTREDKVQARKQASCDDTLRYYENVDFSSSFECSNKSVKRVNKVGCIPYTWRGELPGQIEFAALDMWLTGASAELKYTGPKGQIGYMAYNTYAQYRKFIRQVLTGNGYLRRDSIGSPVQPILAIICFVVALLGSGVISFVLPWFWAVILWSDLPLGYDSDATRSWSQLWLSLGTMLIWIIGVPVMCCWNVPYQFVTIFLWASLVAPVVYANPGELVSIFLCHKEFFAVLFMTLSTLFCFGSLAPSTAGGLAVCWALSTLYYISTLL